MRTVGIYRNQDLVFCTGEVSSLLYNAIRGFADIGKKLYDEKLATIKIGPYIVNIIEHSEEVFVFSISDRKSSIARDFLDYVCEVYEEYKSSGNPEVLQKIASKKL